MTISYDCTSENPFSIYVELPARFLQAYSPRASIGSLRILYRQALDQSERCEVWNRFYADVPAADYRQVPMNSILKVFTQAKKTVVYGLRMNRAFFMSLVPSNLGPNPRPETLNALQWLQRHYDALTRDLAATPFSLEQPGESCAITDLAAPSAPIRLGPACKQLMFFKELRWLLIHESSHHLGVTDERNADEIANIVTDTYRGNPDEGSTFDPHLRRWLDGHLTRVPPTGI
jgi:hypothetical protein